MTATLIPPTKPTPLPRRRSGRTPLQRLGSMSATAAKYTSLVIAAIVTLLPLSVLLFASMKSSSEYAATGPFDPPSNWLNFDNFVTAFTSGKMLEGFVNTTIVLAVSLVGTIALGTMAAYALDRFAFRGKKLVMGLFLLATLIPGVTSQVATFQLVNGLGLYDTKAALILLFMGTDIIAIYLFIQFMQSIPISLDEAAMIDGANRWTIYWRVILPLLRPAIATVVIIKGIAVYNEFYAPFLYLPSEGMISTSLFRFKGPFGAQWEVIAAGTLVVIIPTLVAFLVLQRWIYQGLTSGAVK
ncbi:MULTISPECIES: carbohydrate ABC transporter permease [Microbacterium]|uniref:Carbohydrate ABC transporter permease n=1 Tax=Microbacterium aquilitoris TaxID=3067307 RepID=A0ABU3GLK9_9MICO|nr:MULTISPECIES: carbohydrate ABC transporter permease [unclassified Microbacterium]MDT3330434.1 carbohydrate ABC transporter permease [Microbacterium sp. KSW-18]MDT3344809.1 carbohydrate ABC transporter permease [Microbacterium sp. KSW2-22]SDG41800.1 carbohydrate ABC transporter membrane protein 2, CUT1 family [Microbacterium sp. 77mftsu3.1]